jgi:hypothetical protein
MSEQLQAALAAEHAAIFGYGVLGPHLTGQGRIRAVTAEQAHRDRRNALAAVLIKAQLEPVAAEPAYALPFPVEDRASAMKLAIQLEERTAAAWRAVVPAVTAADRTMAIEALTECAVMATRWRRALAPNAPATVAFPGV